MPNEDRALEKFKAIENFINDLMEMQKEIAELKASEANSRMAAEVLGASEKKYREVVENLPQRIFVKDKNLYYVFCNESYALDFRITSKEIVGKTDYDLYPKELADQYLTDEKRILSTGKMEEIEDKYIISGKELAIHFVKTPLRDEEGNVTGILGTFWDIGEKKRVEEEREVYCLHLKELISERVAEIESLNDKLHKEAATRQRLDEEFLRVRTSLEVQLSTREADLERVSRELQGEVSKRRGDAEVLQQAINQIETLMDSLRRITNSLVSEHP